MRSRTKEGRVRLRKGAKEKQLCSAVSSLVWNPIRSLWGSWDRKWERMMECSRLWVFMQSSSPQTDSTCAFRWFWTSRLCLTLHYTCLCAAEEISTEPLKTVHTLHFIFILVTAHQLTSSSSSTLKTCLISRVHFLCQMFCFSKVKHSLRHKSTLCPGNLNKMSKLIGWLSSYICFMSPIAAAPTWYSKALELGHYMLLWEPIRAYFYPTFAYRSHLWPVARRQMYKYLGGD